jgi:hypothetical protein
LASCRPCSYRSEESILEPLETRPNQEQDIGKNRNTFAKMQRDKQKKFKADEKRKRRLNRKNEGSNESDSAESEAVDADSDEMESVEADSVEANSVDTVSDEPGEPTGNSHLPQES